MDDRLLFYSYDLSPPCRAVWMALETLGAPYEFRLTVTASGDTRTPEFLKLNPQHTIPVVVDGDQVLTESRAILTYLAQKFSSTDHLYPEDLAKRTVVDQRLYFDMGCVWDTFSKIFISIVKEGRLPSAALMARAREVLGWMEDFCSTSSGPLFGSRTGGYMAGDRMTVADLAMLANFAAFRESEVVDLEASYPGLLAWERRCAAQIPRYAETNLSGAAKLGSRVRRARQKLIAATADSNRLSI